MVVEGVRIPRVDGCSRVAGHAVIREAGGGAVNLKVLEVLPPDTRGVKVTYLIEEGVDLIRSTEVRDGVDEAGRG